MRRPNQTKARVTDREKGDTPIAKAVSSDNTRWLTSQRSRMRVDFSLSSSLWETTGMIHYSEYVLKPQPLHHYGATRKPSKTQNVVRTVEKDDGQSESSDVAFTNGLILMLSVFIEHKRYKRLQRGGWRDGNVSGGGGR